MGGRKSPHRVENFSITFDSEQLVGNCGGVQVGSKPVVEICIRYPYLLQELVGHHESFEFCKRCVERQSIISPRLPKVRVHGVRLLPRELVQ
jgi:hypothetical protein